MARIYHQKSRTPAVKHRSLPRGKSRDQIRGEGKEAPPRVHRQAQRLLADIGRPEPAPFRPDPFQVEALERVMKEDVLVTAPTGSGKTWIALEAAKVFLARGRGVWYATPLKALSNAKYEEFSNEVGADRVGILTGDRKENPDAPIIVGTTEILRNQLYDAMHEGRDLDVDLVILDEAHYLGDTERGVVWEEVLIYLPGRVRLLLLSATVSNADDVARWLVQIRSAPCSVVRAIERPVPLHVLFLTPSGQLTPFLQGRRLFSKVAHLVQDRPRKSRRTENDVQDMNGIVDALRQADLLPAIIFLKSRADCDRALQDLRPSPIRPDSDGFANAVSALTADYPELKNQPQMKRLLLCRAGSHHAGRLPAWRLLIEKMMVQGYLEVIFSTSTVAAGVNFPARTVVILQSDRFNGRTFVDMTATEFHQMTGRAGRRGMDEAGFTLIVPGKYLDIPLVKHLLLSEPEPLESRITINFSMTLNLLLSHDPKGVRELLKLSFASFHENPRKADKVHRKLVREFDRHMRLLQELDYLDENGAPTYDGRWAAQLRLDHPLLIAELIRQEALQGREADELAAAVAPFVLDKDREVVVSRELWQMTRHLWKKFRAMARQLGPLMGFMASRGFEAPSIMFWPAAAVYLWADGVDWSLLVDHVDADEGDLAMLILRTADHVRQLIALEKEQPALAETARRAVQLLVRPPLV